jgi:plasmid replication initiation protein
MWYDATILPMGNTDMSELVVKSNRLVEACYRLGIVEQRIVLLSIVQARETGRGLSPRDFVSISTADYAKHYKESDLNNAYTQLKTASRTLFDREFILHDQRMETGKDRVTWYRWVSAASYIDGDGVVQLQFTPIVVEHITRLEAEFTKYYLENIAGMTSTYAVRLYELLIQWGSIGKKEVEVEWLKKALMVNAEYLRVTDFKRWVIDVGISQVNEFSDLTASYTQRKTGRVVTHLLFTFSKKPIPKKESQQETDVAKPPKQPLPEPDGKGFFRLAKAPISPKQQADYLKLRTGEEIELCIERANEYGDGQENAGKPVRYGAIYRKAIEEGWHQEKARQKAQEDTARKQAEASRQQAAEAKRAEKEEAKRSEMERELAAAWFSALPDDEKKMLGSAFVAESNPVDVGLFKRKGYDCTGFRFFIKRKWLESGKPIG